MEETVNETMAIGGNIDDAIDALKEKANEM